MIHGPLSMPGGFQQGPRTILEDLDPVPEIGGMTIKQLGSKPDPKAKGG